jgi:hypothetical protein
MAMHEGLSKYLQIESVVAIPSSDPRTSHSRIAEARSSGIEVFEYSSRKQLEDMVRSERLTHNYVFSGGGPQEPSYCVEDKSHWRLLDTTHITRVVFRNYKPHGDYYLYVSEWLYDWSKKFPRMLMPHPENTLVSWMPHPVQPLFGDGPEFRKAFGIPMEAKLVGRIGGYDQFDDRAARGAVFDLLKAREDVCFAAVNTEFFGFHERLIYIPELNRKLVWDFYAACDLLLNGRLMGESFGFSIVEPLSVGKPVVAPSLRRNIFMDLNHLKILSPLSLTYLSRRDLFDALLRQLNGGMSGTQLRSMVQNYSPERVFDRFDKLLGLR